MTDDQPSVRVGLGTIYDKLVEIDKKVDPLPASFLDHERRIRLLEQRVWAAIGIAGIIAAASPFLSRLIP